MAAFNLRSASRCAVMAFSRPASFSGSVPDGCIMDCIMAAMMPMMQSMMQPSGTLPEKLAGREKAMTAHLEALRKLKSAIEPLYAALSDEQKKTADQLMVGPMGIMGMGMM